MEPYFSEKVMNGENINRVIHKQHHAPGAEI